MHNRLRLVLIIVSIVLLTSCGDQRILERLGVTHTATYDLAENEEQSDKKLIVSITIPRPESAGGKGNSNSNREFLQATSATSKEGRINLSKQTELILVSGQMRNTLFGINLAKEGVWEYIDALLRDPSVSPQIKITVVNGSAYQLLSKDYSQHSRTGQYIERMLDKESQSQTVPKMDLFRFSRDYWDDGIDSVAPMIKDAGNHVEIDGIALFRGDRYITKVETDQALIFAFLRGPFKRGELSIDLTKVGRSNERMMLSSISSERKIKVTSKNDNNEFHIDLRIKVSGTILEYIGTINLNSENGRVEAERLIAEYIKNQLDDMIAMLQENNVDSIGIGKHVRATLNYQQWKSMDWHEVFPNIKVNTDVKISIKDIGEVLE